MFLMWPSHHFKEISIMSDLLLEPFDRWTNWGLEKLRIWLNAHVIMLINV